MKYTEIMTALSDEATRCHLRNVRGYDKARLDYASGTSSYHPGSGPAANERAQIYQDLRWAAAQALFRYLRPDGAAQIAIAERAGFDVQCLSALKGCRHWKGHVKRPVFEALLASLPPDTPPRLEGASLIVG